MLKFKGHTFLGDGARCSCCADAKVASADPTGTSGLRAKMRATMALRWRKLRVFTKQIIVEHDLLQIVNGGLMPVKSPAIMGGSSKVQAFQRWIDHALNAIVLGGDGSVMRPMLNEGYEAGTAYAHRLVKVAHSHRAAHTRDTVYQLAVVELQGIMEAVSQQSVRAVANALMTGQRPAAIVALIFDKIEKIGVERTNLMVDQLIVTAFNQAALDCFEAAGIRSVGLVAEAKPAKRIGDGFDDAKRRRAGPGAKSGKGKSPSARTIRRIKAAQRKLEALGQVNVVTAGDDDVCPICEDIAESGPYNINVARSLIPAHPRCRCAFSPVGAPGDDDE